MSQFPLSKLDPGVPVVFTHQMARSVESHRSDIGTGIECKYFTAFIRTVPGGTQDDNFWGSKNPDWAIQAVRTATGGGTINNTLKSNYRMFQTEFMMRHRIHNQSEGRLRIDAWRCMCRMDQGRNQPDDSKINQGAAYEEPLNLLGQGFAGNNIDGTVADQTNAGMRDLNLTPFNSPVFCRAYKILEAKHVALDPGHYQAFYLKDKKRRRVKPELYQLAFASATVWNDISVPTSETEIIHVRGEQFWLFRVYAGTIGEAKDDAGTAAFVSAQKIQIISDMKYEYAYWLAAVAAQYYRLPTIGFYDSTSGTVAEIIDDEENEIEDLDNVN